MRILSAISAIVLGVLQAPAPPPGSALRAGMTLTYESEGKTQPPWTVEAATIGASLKDGAACSIVRLRRAPGAAAPADARLCVDGGILLHWNEQDGKWVPQRPVAPGLTLKVPRPNGETVDYTAGSESSATIGGVTVSAIETTVTTVDAAGRPIRRLRERYALALTTAVEGRFEAADATDPSGWRTTQSFVLREIR